MNEQQRRESDQLAKELESKISLALFELAFAQAPTKMDEFINRVSARVAQA